MKVKRFGRNLIVAVKIIAAVLMCVYMWGCGNDMEWNNDFGGAEVIGFIDDSLTIVYDTQGWHQDLGSFVQDHGDISGRGHQRLRVFNYRVQENGPRLADTLDNDDVEDFNYVKGQLSDSVIWGGDPKSVVSFWKIGSKPRKMNVKKMFDGCSIDVRYTTKLRPWLGGKILVMGNTLNPDIDGFNLDSLGSDYCQYAVLDTIQKVITYKRLNADLIWIKRCDDVRAWGDDVYCVLLDKETYDAKLVVNGNVKFTMERQKYTLGDYAKVSFMGPFVQLHQTVYSYQSDEIERKTSFSSQGISFGAGNGNYITY
ncbi:MAG: hypothetical protein J6T54_08675 [Fibrobacter sp.]|nr:hypothetical protein [Fibrobacter sp.]